MVRFLGASGRTLTPLALSVILSVVDVDALRGSLTASALRIVFSAEAR
jgi:hypothetical protein